MGTRPRPLRDRFGVFLVKKSNVFFRVAFQKTKKNLGSPAKAGLFVFYFPALCISYGMENKKENNSGVTVTVTGQALLVVTGATAVEGVTDSQVTVALPRGKFTARGKNLKVKGFMEDRGELTVMGEISNFSFAAPKTPFIKRMFR